MSQRSTASELRYLEALLSEGAQADADSGTMLLCYISTAASTQ